LSESDLLDKEPSDDLENAMDRIEPPDVDTYLIVSIFALLTSVVFIGIVLAEIAWKKSKDYREFIKMSPHRYSPILIKKADSMRLLAMFALLIPVPFYGFLMLFYINEILYFLF
jgi:hypothetical protein